MERVAEQIRSLINKASGKKLEAYMHMLFPRSVVSPLRYEILKNILKLIEPLGNTKNNELLHLKQKILLEISKLGPSFIRKNSRISSSTIYEYQKKSKRATILSRSPKKSGAQSSPTKIIKKFVSYLNEPDNSGTQPVVTTEGIKTPVRHLTKPIDSIIN